MILTTKWHGRGHGCASFSSSAIPLFKPRKKIGVVKVGNESQSESVSEPQTKKANLSAARKERIQLPTYGTNKFHISEFLSHPSAIETLLNTNALKSFQCLGTNTYRCTLHRVRLLNFEAGPVLDLRVTPTNEDCTVEMLSCKFEGSKIMEHQNDHFSALMRNHMTWDTNDSESFLEVDVTLNLILEIYTHPFTMMPVSAVERPGNLMLQALLDRLVPLLLQQLLQDYAKWVHQQLDLVP
ncbi:hypothetical protein PanWU01x14_061460 [Parasponia andersonii]|uniref:Uncharacterized protein n=1 Tax=Parasponia andersonii TaxID=3476 RepID=A0A2P5DI78_PARAD|nr:hypothetical protein PanWU01x14_061460 [Parasponia andersonii]